MLPLFLFLALQALRHAEMSASPSASAVALPSASASSCDRKFACVSCSQAQFCRTGPSGLKEAYRVTCGDSTPYCDPGTGACIETAPKGCAELGFVKCMSDGVFPDPDDCRAYHVCEKGVSNTFKCAKGQYFNGTTCEESTVCNTPFTCVGKSGTKVAHPRVKSVFAYCLNSKVLFVDKCTNNWIMDEKKQKCQPVYRPCLNTLKKSGPAKCSSCRGRFQLIGDH